MDDSLRTEDVIDAFTASLISRLSDLGASVRRFFKETIDQRSLPMAERDGTEMNRLDAGRGEIEKECNFYQTEVTEHVALFTNDTLAGWVTHICEMQTEYRDILYRLDIAPASGQHLDQYPERSIDTYMTDYALETVNLINGFKSETLPKFHQDQLAFVQSLLAVSIGNGQEVSLLTMLRRDEPMTTFETIASTFDTEIAGQIESVTAIGTGLASLRQRVTEITMAFNQFKANPVPLDI